MIVEVIKTDWFLGQNPPEGTVTVRVKNGSIIEAFAYGQHFSAGNTVEVEFDSLDADLDWGVRFTENKGRERKLVKTANDWEYEGYGQIKSILPVVIDFGGIELATGNAH